LNLGDVMRELSDAPLKNHTWTQSILNALNAILPGSSLLTEDSTGRQVLQAMAILPELERNRLLTSTVDLIQGTFTLSSDGSDPTSSGVSKSESFHQAIINDLVANPSRAVMIFFAFVIVVLSIFLAITITVTYAKTGKVPDTSWFMTLIQALMSILSAMSNQSTPSMYH